MNKNQPMTVKRFAKMKGKRIAVLTAYDYFTARYLEQAGVDALLVGDSMNTVVYGEASTLSADMEQMLRHTKAVVQGAPNSLVIGDMPFMSYQPSDRDAILNAGRFLKEAGAQAVKLEGGVERTGTIARIVQCGIPVMGHIGLTPQSIHRFGGYKVQGKDEASANYLKESAQALCEAGVFSMVVEGVPMALGKELTEIAAVPTIGIGAGPHTDGQVMVINDISGMFEGFKPKFVRHYANLAQALRDVAAAYIKDVKDGTFPSEEESY